MRWRRVHHTDGAGNCYRTQRDGLRFFLKRPALRCRPLGFVPEECCPLLRVEVFDGVTAMRAQLLAAESAAAGPATDAVSYDRSCQRSHYLGCRRPTYGCSRRQNADAALQSTDASREPLHFRARWNIEASQQRLQASPRLHFQQRENTLGARHGVVSDPCSTGSRVIVNLAHSILRFCSAWRRLLLRQKPGLRAVPQPNTSRRKTRRQLDRARRRTLPPMVVVRPGAAPRTGAATVSSRPLGTPQRTRFEYTRRPAAFGCAHRRVEKFGKGLVESAPQANISPSICPSPVVIQTAGDAGTVVAGRQSSAQLC